MGSTATIHTTTNAGAIRYPGTRRIDRQSTNGHLFYVSVSGNTYQVYRSTNKGVSWSAFGSSRTSADSQTIQEMGGLHVDWQNRLYFAYRTSQSSQDKIYMQAGVITSTNVSWHTPLLVASAANGGVAGNYFKGMTPGIVRHSDGRTTGFVAATYQSGTQMGVACYGFTIAAVGQPVLNLGVVAGKRSWQFTQSAGGHTAPGVSYELSPAHMWVTWGRTYLHTVKMTWNGSGWNGPTTAVRLSYYGTGTPAPPAMDALATAWRNPGLLAAQPYQYDTTAVVIFERNQANTRTSPYVTPAHPAGVVKHCTITYNNVTRDFRVYAVGTSDNLLYYVDYIHASGSFSGWSSVSATAVAGIDNYSVRRESFGSARYDVVVEQGAASPWNVVHVSQDLVYAPFAPRWQFGQGGNNLEGNGRAWDTGRDAELRWIFSDPDTDDAQTAWALSRQVGAGTIQYLRASDGTWQATEQKNPGATGSRTLPGITWGLPADANHTYRVKVWDSSDTPSAYSDALTIVPSAYVNPTITSPAVDGQVITTDTLTLEWTVAEQTAFRVRVRIFSDVLYDSGWIAGSQDSFYVPYRMNDGWNYSFELFTRNNEGLATTGTIRTIACDIQTPPDPLVTLTLMPEQGVIRVNVLNGEPAAENTNTGFETNLTGWAAGPNTAFTRVTTDTRNGSAGAARVVSTTGTQLSVYAEGSTSTAGTPGETFTVWAWVRPDTTNKPVAVFLHWYNGGTYVSTTTASVPAGAAGVYQEVTLQAQMPAGCTGVRAAAGGTGTPAISDGFTVDDVRLMRGAQPKVTHNVIQRRRELSVFDTSTMVEVTSGIDPNTPYDDWTVRSGYPYEYRVLAIGDNGTTSYSAWTY